VATAFRRGALLLDLSYCAQLSWALLDAELAAEGVKAELLGLLTQIRLLEPVTPSALSMRTGIAPATLYDYVGRLVEEKLVRRDPNPADGRSHLISTTEAGVARVQGSSPAVRRAVARIVEHLDQSLEDAERFMFELRGALEAAQGSRVLT
jgi:DNA-binding MarR family transcriptional regulator